MRHRNFMRRHFKPAMARAGLPEQLRFHDLRHTAAALVIAEGATMEQVKQILGHSTIRVTSDTYGHLSMTIPTRSWRPWPHAACWPLCPKRAQTRWSIWPRRESAPAETGADMGFPVERTTGFEPATLTLAR